MKKCVWQKNTIKNRWGDDKEKCQPRPTEPKVTRGRVLQTLILTIRIGCIAIAIT